MNVLARMLDLAMLPGAEIPAPALARARASLLDWITCGRAGIGEPVAGKLRRFAGSEGVGRASLFGGGQVPARMAALVNGATSHALDYDDTHFDHVGHLSVGIYPAALAVGEEVEAAATAVVEAFLTGAEAAILLGRVLGRAHYDRGFHQTATAGAFGATIAAGRLRGLTRGQMQAALGLCATRAAGLKSQFGTMGKPYNAGQAASNGVEAAALAALGLSSAEDGIEGPQGFVPTHSDLAGTVEPAPGFRFMRNSYKFHACCHGTHAMIEGMQAVLAGRRIAPERVQAIRLRTNPRWLSVCNIAVPRSGLEVKFSYRWLAAMVLQGLPTGDDRLYTDDLAADAALAALAQKLDVSGDDAMPDQQAAGEILLESGETIAFAHDLSAAMDGAELQARLLRKAEGMLGDEAAALAALLAGLADLSARDLGDFIRKG